MLLDRDAFRDQAEVKNNELLSVTLKLVEINKSRNKLQGDIKFYEDKIDDLKRRISTSSINLEAIRNEIERADSEIMKLTNEREDLKSKITHAERHYDQSQKQYEEKISAISEVANQNKKKKETWANNYEKEMKSHSDTKEELIKTQTKLKEIEMTLNNLRISTKAIKKMNNDNEERNSEINNQLMKLAIENEKHMREAKTNARLLQITKEEWDRNINDLEHKIVEEKDRLKIKEQLIYMQMEDAFSLSIRWEDKYKLMLKKFGDLTEDTLSKTNHIAELNRVILNLKEQNYTLCSNLEQTQMILSEYEELFHITDKENIKLNQDILEQDKINRKQKAKELKVLVDKLKIANKRIADLNSKFNNTVDDRGTQATVTTTDQTSETDFTFQNLAKLETDLVKYKAELDKTKTENEKLNLKAKQLQEDLDKRGTTELNSHPNTVRKLTPKYKQKLNENESQDYDEVLLGDNSENGKIDGDLKVNSISSSNLGSRRCL